MTVLRARFGLVPEEGSAAITASQDERVLDTLLVHAAKCRSLATFRTRILS